MTHLTHDSAALVIGGHRIPLDSMTVEGELHPGDSPFSVATRPPVTGSMLLDGIVWKVPVATMQRTKAIARAIDSFVSIVVGDGWTRARLPISGRRWRWRSR